MKAIDLIIKHEGKKLYPYRDSVGKLTIGVGHNLDDNGLSNRVVEMILKEDINSAIEELDDIFDNWDELPEIVQAVMIDMMFNLGYNRFIKFKKMIAAIKNHDYKKAAEEAKDSKWCKQVKSRCEENYALLMSA